MGWEVEGTIRRAGTCVYLWLIHVDVWQKPTQHCKAMILQLKVNKLFLKYGYTMEYSLGTKRNEIASFSVMWMNLESVIQSEVSQKEKNK